MYTDYSEFDRDDDGGSGIECDLPIPGHTRFRSMSTTLAGRPAGYPPHAKRHRPMFESVEYKPLFSTFFPWHENDNQIHSLIESQKKMMKMLEKVYDRVGDIEKELKTVKNQSPSSSGTSPEAKKKNSYPDISEFFSATVQQWTSIHFVEASDEQKQFRPQLG